MQVCSVYEKGVVFECCRFSHDPELCRNCGYLSYAEIDQTLKLKPSALFNALKYFGRPSLRDRVAVRAGGPVGDACHVD